MSTEVFVGKSNQAVLKIILLIFFFSSFLFVFYKMSYHFPSNSDEAVLPLEALDIKQGNVLLHGWTLPADHFYTIDLMFHLGALFLGATPRQTMHIVPSVIYTLITFISCYFVFTIRKLDLPSETRYFGIIVTFMFVSFPVQLAAKWASYSPDHLGTLLYVLFALIFLFHSMKKSNKKTKNIHFVLFSTVAVLANIGDPLSIYILNLPLIILGMFILLKDLESDFRKDSFKIILISFLSALIATVLHHNYATWAFNVAGPTPRFVELNLLGHNLYLYLESVLGLFGADFFGKEPTSLPAIAALVHISVLIFSIYIISNILKSSFKFDIHRLTQNKMTYYVEFYFVVSVLLVSFSFIFSNFPVDLDEARYLFLVPVFSAILSGLYVSQLRYSSLISKSHAIHAIFIMIFFIYLVDYLVLERPFDRVKQPYDPIVDFLRAHKMKEGFGTYWGANVITALSNDHIKCRAVTYAGGHITPYHWASKEAWYRMSHANFFVFNQNSKAFGIDRTIIIKDFGNPSQQETINGYTILIWNHDITLNNIR